VPWNFRAIIIFINSYFLRGIWERKDGGLLIILNLAREPI
jgi:hypothetical protein